MIPKMRLRLELIVSAFWWSRALENGIITNLLGCNKAETRVVLRQKVFSSFKGEVWVGILLRKSAGRRWL